jgi:hypothetical protein
LTLSSHNLLQEMPPSSDQYAEAINNAYREGVDTREHVSSQEISKEENKGKKVEDKKVNVT